MPARIRVAAFSRTPLIYSSSTAFQHELRSSSRYTRHFSQSLRSSTVLRDQFYAWLSGPGQNFEKPLPGSTNYLSAYTSDGVLRRQKEETKVDEKEKSQESSAAKVANDGASIDGQNADDPATAMDNPDNTTDTPEEPEELKEEELENDQLKKESLRDLRPFPMNQQFVSESVLSESVREDIYNQVVNKGTHVVKASADANISIERVAAVVRLKQIEKNWLKDGKPLARAYSRAVLSMLPQTTSIAQAHESITDIPILPSTTRQVFHPVPESRHFTRADAAKAFSDNLKPADERMPHQELILTRKLQLQGERQHAIRIKVAQFAAQQEKERIGKREALKRREEKRTTVVAGRRWDFQIKEIKAEDVGYKGKNPKGTGWRYGMPHEDRKRALIKIPERVEA
ncbi:hypothetical protein EJ05DRAFT_537319 [Pseudovirgaria hyperparasitica]|uniref:Ribosomal protein S35, mitochondrial n=1 Tax=Pseudovirgaria hyperparasitica TaxID=470096 RepID=A0A6A6WAG0_9PEZI|nr:uncharacterized protein EJ05DRAFT_537319 [Pseudovirgaria hyperparasitica]KAF2758940.1 hypothetical protein EJ05DRAFT_537319 [Pseudovirgaria hyperparasitica]